MRLKKQQEKQAKLKDIEVKAVERKKSTSDRKNSTANDGNFLSVERKNSTSQGSTRKRQVSINDPNGLGDRLATMNEEIERVERVMKRGRNNSKLQAQTS